MFNIANNEKDDQTLNDCNNKANEIQNTLRNCEKICFLSGENDDLNIYLEIHAGAGGTESQDWADMLRRMYIKWLDKKNYKYEVISEHKGDEAGIKSSILRADGDYLYGLMRAESGVHRLVRISPFDSGARRHTSFASVWVYPVVDDDIDIKIDEKDLRVDTYRSSGAGGQHVNTTDSAVRITHLPTRIVVQCQSDRSQHKNRSNAMKMIRSRIYEVELQKRKESENLKNKEKKDIGWGNQIRSYVLHPYKLIKDLRSGYETSKVNEVLDGKINDFLENSLTL